MAKYAIFFRFTSQAIKGLIETPSDRAAIVAKLAEQAGGRMEAYYLMFGDWDGFVIAEAPDSKSAAAMSLAVTSSGAFAQLKTHELIDPADLAGILSKAGSLGYTAPGS